LIAKTFKIAPPFRADHVITMPSPVRHYAPNAGLPARVGGNPLGIEDQKRKVELLVASTNHHLINRVSIG
jgi:hypothetical protein